MGRGMGCSEDTSIDFRKDGLKSWNANKVSSNPDFPSLKEEGKHCPAVWGGWAGKRPDRDWRAPRGESHSLKPREPSFQRSFSNSRLNV